MMLRPADNVRLGFDPLPDGQGWLVLDLEGEEIRVKRATPLDFRRILRSTSEAPYLIAVVSGAAVWLYREEYFWADVGLTQDEVQREIAWSLPAS